MGLPLYLAMTAAEIFGAAQMPEHCAYMACHFSPYGTGLSNSPEALPEDSMLILNDRTPVQGHDPALIAQQLAQIAEEVKACGLLLDFQRPDSRETSAIVRSVLDMPACPVAVSDVYAKDYDCPVFLCAPPPHCLLANHMAPWKGREIWLEAAQNAETVTVTEKGSHFTPLLSAPALQHRDEHLHCHYSMDVNREQIVFRLHRTAEDLNQLLEEAQALGITKAIGLYQELRKL